MSESDDELFRRHALTFNDAADTYERVRPSYPDVVADIILENAPSSVLDLGAGTGKFTRLLVGRVPTVIAVDPAPSMLDELSRMLPSVDARVGTAEQLPVDDNSVDLVVCAQAWHWVDRDRATPELARVLRPGGEVALVWNSRDRSAAWVDALADLFPSAHGGWTLAEIVRLGHPFTDPEEQIVEWSETIDADGLCALVSTWSQFLVLDELGRAEMLDRVRQLTRTHPDLVGRESWPNPYRTHLFRSRRYA